MSAWRLPFLSLLKRLRGGVGKGWTTNHGVFVACLLLVRTRIVASIKTRFAAHEFDLVHRITPLSPTSQSILARAPG